MNEEKVILLDHGTLNIVDDGLDVDNILVRVVLHNYCLRCNRPIKDPRSRSRGYGPVCWGRMVAAYERASQEGEDA